MTKATELTNYNLIGIEITQKEAISTGVILFCAIVAISSGAILLSFGTGHTASLFHGLGASYIVIGGSAIIGQGCYYTFEKLYSLEKKNILASIATVHLNDTQSSLELTAETTEEQATPIATESGLDKITRGFKPAQFNFYGDEKIIEKHQDKILYFGRLLFHQVKGDKGFIFQKTRHHIFIFIKQPEEPGIISLYIYRKEEDLSKWRQKLATLPAWWRVHC